MKRNYVPVILAALGAIAIGWATMAGAQPPNPAPTPVPAPIQPAPMPETPAPTPIPAPVMPDQPGVIAPVVPMPLTPAIPAPAQPMPEQPAAPTAVPQQPMPVAPTAQPAVKAIITSTGEAPAEMGPGQDATNPTGRQEPAVSIEWLGPGTAKTGQACEYTIVVRNACNIAVQQVLVRVRLAGRASVIATEPKATAEDNILAWEVGTLLPKQEKNLQLRLVSPARGDVAAQAWVTFTGATAMRLRVREPKLAVTAITPEKVMIGDVMTFALTVMNPGDGVAEQVRLHADLGEGLEHPRGKKVDFELGNLNPGESRTVQVVCMAKAGGEQICQAVAEADAGLKADVKAAANVIVPRLDLEVKGPKLRYLDRKALYTFKITNPGDAAAFNVTLTDIVPAGFKVIHADSGGRQDFTTRSVAWFLGELGPGQSREVNLEVVCVSTGEFTHKLAAQASRGLKVEGEALTRVEGLSAIQLEMVDLEDPVEVNGETIYEIRVTNTGTKTETDVKLVCTMPADKQQFKTATGPTAFHVVGNEIAFDPLPSLAPRADAIYRVTVKCTTPGIAKFQARMTSAILSEPVMKEEATRIYAD